MNIWNSFPVDTGFWSLARCIQHISSLGFLVSVSYIPNVRPNFSVKFGLVSCLVLRTVISATLLWPYCPTLLSNLLFYCHAVKANKWLWWWWWWYYTHPVWYFTSDNKSVPSRTDGRTDRPDRRTNNLLTVVIVRFALHASCIEPKTNRIKQGKMLAHCRHNMRPSSPTAPHKTQPKKTAHPYLLLPWGHSNRFWFFYTRFLFWS